MYIPRAAQAAYLMPGVALLAAAMVHVETELRLCLGAGVLTLGGLVILAAQYVRQAAGDDRGAFFDAGYRAALCHVKRGLLALPPGVGDPHDPQGLTNAKVRHLRPTRKSGPEPHEGERKAQ
ncbi:hypothetical protein [Streptomyces sp. URMC 129]|uniref:hypothetical protein n=1 Tax=Streptomyces sp. URMC 129 TaxID=3423407 RepID=UPI003F1A2DC8